LRIFSLKEKFDDLPEILNKAAFLWFLNGWLTGNILYTDMD